MSLQGQINYHTINLVQDIADEFKAKGHPHVNYTINEFFNNYNPCWNNLDLSRQEQFRTDLRNKLQALVNINKEVV